MSCIFFSGCKNEGDNANSLSPALGIGKQFFQENTPPQNDPPVQPKNMTICIDPGHGFTDTGTESDFLGEYYEKDITIFVSNKLADSLRSLGYDVIFTHDGEHFPKSGGSDNIFNPNERKDYINELGNRIDYLVSMHCNSFNNPDVSGTRVYYFESTGVNGESEDCKSAEIIRKHVEEAFPNAVKPTSEIGNYAVIRDTSVVGVLIEMGFVTNESDAKNMLDGEWQTKFAKTIAEGIDSYLDSNKNT